MLYLSRGCRLHRAQCPADSKRKDVGAGYNTLAENLPQFEALKCMPRYLALERFDKGDGIAATFARNKARWHKSCYSLFNSTKLRRAQKRQADEGSDKRAKLTPANATAFTKDSSRSCFLCECPELPLHRVSTLGLDARVRECATLLDDETLLAKLSGGDLVALEASYYTNSLITLYRNGDYAKRDMIPENEMPHRLEGIARSRAREATNFRHLNLLTLQRCIQIAFRSSVQRRQVHV